MGAARAPVVLKPLLEAFEYEYPGAMPANELGSVLAAHDSDDAEEAGAE